MVRPSSSFVPAPEPTVMAEENPPPAQPDPMQLILAFAARARNDHEAVSYYGAALAVALGLFIVFHVAKSLRNVVPGKLREPVVLPMRFLKRHTTRSAPGFTSTGHALIAAGYFALNILFLFVHSDYDDLSMQSVIAARAGWLALANICFTVFLSLRNNPLSLITEWSYERLRFLHGISGFMIIAHILIHGASYAHMFIQQRNAARLRVMDEIYGIAAGFMLLSMIVAAIVVRRMSYELFYVLHVVLFVVGLVFIALHHPDTAEKVIIVVAVGLGIWALDHIIRLGRLGYHGINTTATIYPLPDNATRLVFNKSPPTAKSGQHAYLWIPRIRLLETHPFTIAATSPLEFVVSAHGGFTRDLHKYAQQNPGAMLSASVQGPYGTMPDASKYDRVVFIAGGSGASFAVGVALQLLKTLTSASKQKVVLVWTFRNPAVIDWFSSHLMRLTEQANISVCVYITGDSTADIQSRPQTDKASPPDSVREGYKSSPLNATDVEALQTEVHEVQQLLAFPTKHGRPDVEAIIHREIEALGAQDRVLVMGCGPLGLMEQIRSATTAGMGVRGPSVDLHCEQFRW